MTNDFNQVVESALDKYAAYCDSHNREIEYDTSDNIDFDEAVKMLTEAHTTAVQEAETKARIDELENIYEWGYPGSPHSGIGTHLAEGDTKDIETRLAALQAQSGGKK